MRFIKRILLWIVISLSIQIGSLYYINNFFLADKEVFTSQKVYSETKAPENITANVPYGASSVQPSYDGDYIAYLKDYNLTIKNCAQSKGRNSFQIENVHFYRWLPDRNRLLYAQVEHLKSTDRITLYAYDADNRKKQMVNSVSYLPRNSSVSGIEASPLTNIIYLSISGGDGYDRLYQIDIMGTIKKIWTPVKKIVKMAETQETDNLVYQSSNDIIHVIKDGKKDVYLSYNKYALLGIDSQDNVYLGGFDKGKIAKIYRGTLDKPLNTWDTVLLPEPLDPNSVTVDKNGNIYKIQDGKTLIDVNSNNAIVGKGRILYFNNGLIVYEGNNDNVIIKKLTAL